MLPEWDNSPHSNLLWQLTVAILLWDNSLQDNSMQDNSREEQVEVQLLQSWGLLTWEGSNVKQDKARCNSLVPLLSYPMLNCPVANCPTVSWPQQVVLWWVSWGESDGQDCQGESTRVSQPQQVVLDTMSYTCVLWVAYPWLFICHTSKSW